MRAVVEEAEAVKAEEEAIEAKKSFVVKTKAKWKRRCAPFKCCFKILYYTVCAPISWPRACCKCFCKRCCKKKQERVYGV